MGPSTSRGRGERAQARAACVCHSLRARGEYAPSKQQSAGLVKPSKLQRNVVSSIMLHTLYVCVCVNAKYMFQMLFCWAHHIFFFMDCSLLKIAIMALKSEFKWLSITQSPFYSSNFYLNYRIFTRFRRINETGGFINYQVHGSLNRCVAHKWFLTCSRSWTQKKRPI